MVTVQAFLPLQAPLQPKNVTPFVSAGAGNKVTTVPLAKFCVHSFPQLIPLGTVRLHTKVQLMPAGVELTEPGPPMLTVSSYSDGGLESSLPQAAASGNKQAAASARMEWPHFLAPWRPKTFIRYPTLSCVTDDATR